MRLPKKGQKGFTLIELLIVVAILGVLAAVVIPNIGQFIGAGEEEARETDYTTVQTSVHAMMVDNEISSIPNPLTYAGDVAENDMSGFPDPTSVGATDKLKDADGDDYTALDTPGYLLQDHDATADNAPGPLVDYVAISTSEYYYTCESDGTVRQFDGATPSTANEYTY